VDAKKVVERDAAKIAELAAGVARDATAAIDTARKVAERRGQLIARIELEINTFYGSALPDYAHGKISDILAWCRSELAKGNSA